MATIHLIDISAVVFSGALANRSRDWNTHYFPTGGLYKAISMILRINRKLKKGDNIIVCFEGKGSIRKDTFPEYKANRKFAKNPIDREIVSVQLEVLREFLTKIGVPNYSIDGYEADDVIYSLVAKHIKDKVIIHADDSDYYDTRLLHPNVTMESVTGKDIVMRTHTTILKITEGDLKDNVPRMVNDHHKRAVLTAYNKRILTIYRQGTIQEQIAYLRSINMPEEMIPEVSRNIFLKQPKMIEFEEVPQINIDKKELSTVLNILGFKSILKSELGEERDYYSPQVKDGLINLLSKTSIDLKHHFQKVREKGGSDYLTRNPEVDLGDRKVVHRVRDDLDDVLKKMDEAMSTDM